MIEIWKATAQSVILTRYVTEKDIAQINTTVTEWSNRLQKTPNTTYMIYQNISSFLIKGYHATGWQQWAQRVQWMHGLHHWSCYCSSGHAKSLSFLVFHCCRRAQTHFHIQYILPDLGMIPSQSWQIYSKIPEDI